jgi:NADP-dependent 3-hydroxy acid dehydrogenase YdfG
MGRLSSKVVAITGASSGIGEAAARRLADEGAAVVLSARRADRLEALAGAVRAAGGRALAVRGDVTDLRDMDALVARSVEAFGRIDVMICNAGIGYHGPLEDTPPDAMRRLVDVNIMGTLYAARAALAVMRTQGHGHIIAVSSIAGRRGVGGSSVYSATKAAQIGFIEALRAEFLGTKLHASIIYPVRTRTEFHDAIARDFGLTVTGRGPTQSAEHVARTIADVIAFPRPEVYPHRLSRLLSVLSVLAPRQADRVMKRFGRRPAPVRHSPHDAPHS